MSAGLMSCVRQSSPPLELTTSSDGAPSSRATTSSTVTTQRLDDVSSLNTTQKRRRRFHPLRNLRRIFRIGSTDDTSLNSSAYRPASEPDHSDDYTQSGSRLSPPDTPIRVVPSTTYTNSSSCDSLLYSPQRPQREQRRRHPSAGQFDQQGRGQHKPVLHLRKSRESLYRDNEDSTDFQRRSISECLGADLKNDSLSQSHDSVFSESVTASSMSIGLKAELANVLRKKYYERSVSSERNAEADEEDDEDLGFPRSPNTPKRGASGSATSPMKHSQTMSSEGSLSMMSMGSSELTTTHSPSTKFRLTKSKTETEDDVTARFSQPLNHSAARHKMSVRPKKKAPSRLSRIQTVEEVSHDLTALDETDTLLRARLKSSSLPPGVDAKQSKQHTEAKTTISINESSSTTKQLYVNRHLSKSFDFESTSRETLSTSTGGEKDKDVNGFFRRLLNRSSIKKKVIAEESPAAPLSTIVQVPEPNTVEPPKPKPAVKPDKPKSGPAARQRVLPREIPGSPQKLPDLSVSPKKQPIIVLNTDDHLPPSSPTTKIPISVHPFSPKKPTELLPPKPSSTPRVFEAKPSRSNKVLSVSGVGSRVSSEYQLKHQEEPSSSQNHHRSDDQLFPRFYKQSSNVDPTHRRSVQSSQSTNCIVQSINTVDDLQSASSTPARKPVEKSKSFRFYTETSADSSLHCSAGHMPSLPDLSFTSGSSSTTTTTSSPNHRDLINKFEINDNNLVFSANKQTKIESLTGSRKTVFVTTTCESNTPSIGELTDKSPSKVSPPTVVKLPADPKIVPSKSASNINQIEDNIDRIMKFACVTVLKTPATPAVTKTDAHVISRSSITATVPFVKSSLVEDESKDRRFSNESVEISEKPTLDAGVFVERRKSVSDEKLKFERKIQERFRSSAVTEAEADSRKSSLSEGDAIASPAVVLRKKSVSYGARPATTIAASTSPFVASDDQTPELMKVFARRSLKLKDLDDYVVCSTEDETKLLLKPDSSTEVAPKGCVETTTPVAILSARGASSTTSAVRVSAKQSLVASVSPPATTSSLVARLSGGYHGLIAHSTMTAATTTSTSHKSISLTPVIKTASLITNNNGQIGTHNTSINNNNNSIHIQSGANKLINNNNNNVLAATVAAKPVVKIGGEYETNDNEEVVTLRADDEFKGILQRRAEWEKRATQTFK